MPASSARAARPTSSWSTATRSAIPPRSGGCGDGSGATAEGSSLVRPVLLFADLLVAEAAPAHDAVAVGDHAGVAAEVDGAVAGAQAGLVRVLAQHVLDTAGLAGPLRVVPRTAHRTAAARPAPGRARRSPPGRPPDGSPCPRRGTSRTRRRGFAAPRRSPAP